MARRTVKPPRTVECAECGEPFEAKSPRAKYCSPKCRKSANRRPTKTGAAEPEQTSEPQGFTVGQLLGQVIADLEKAEVLNTIPGRAAVALAYRVESPMETGSAAAAMTRELSRLVDEAKALAPKQQDGIDTLGDSVGAKLRLVT